MAYMSQETKARLAPAIKEVCRKHGIKATISVRSHMTLELNVSAGKIDFLASGKRMGSIGQDVTKVDYSINTYWYHRHFDGEALTFLTEVIAAMNDGNHNNSDPMTDYYDVGWYIEVKLGSYEKPYQLI